MEGRMGRGGHDFSHHRPGPWRRRYERPSVPKWFSKLWFTSNRAGETLFCKSQMVNNSGSEGHRVCYIYSVLPLWRESSKIHVSRNGFSCVSIKLYFQKNVGCIWLLAIICQPLIYTMEYYGFTRNFTRNL